MLLCLKCTLKRKLKAKIENKYLNMLHPEKKDKPSDFSKNLRSIFVKMTQTNVCSNFTEIKDGFYCFVECLQHWWVAYPIYSVHNYVWYIKMIAKETTLIPPLPEELVSGTDQWKWIGQFIIIQEIIFTMKQSFNIMAFFQ